jgi:hypothetical protein
VSLQQLINKYLVKLIIFGDTSACKVYIVKFIVSLTLLMGLVVPEIWGRQALGLDCSNLASIQLLGVFSVIEKYIRSLMKYIFVYCIKS